MTQEHSTTLSDGMLRAHFADALKRRKPLVVVREYAFRGGSSRFMGWSYLVTADLHRARRHYDSEAFLHNVPLSKASTLRTVTNFKGDFDVAKLRHITSDDLRMHFAQLRKASVRFFALIEQSENNGQTIVRAQAVLEGYDAMDIVRQVREIGLRPGGVSTQIRYLFDLRGNDFDAQLAAQAQPFEVTQLPPDARNAYARYRAVADKTAAPKLK